MLRKPTLRDVSVAAQVSIYTASRALSGGNGVSAATRRRVLRVAADIGYIPNQHARNLKTSRSTAVAVLTANIANQYYSVLINSLEAVLEQEGYNCIAMDTIINGAYSQTREDRFITSIMSQRVAAAVITYNLSQANMELLSAWGIPLIFVDCPAPKDFGPFSCVTTDNYQGSLEMGRHLAKLGYRRWAFVGHTSTWSSRFPRQEGFEAAAQESGSNVDILEGLNASATSREVVTHYLKQRHRDEWPQVIYASNTVLLHGVFEALRLLNISIPQDIAVVAFDDFEWARMINPPVSVVDQDIDAIGKSAGRLLLQAFSNDPKKIETLVLKPKLRIRQSCGCELRAVS